MIRYLGGLLSAYALSGEPILLARADDLGRMLLPALNTPSGLPMFAVNTQTYAPMCSLVTFALISNLVVEQSRGGAGELYCGLKRLVVRWSISILLISLVERSTITR